MGVVARRCGVPLRPPVPPQRHDCPQLRGGGGLAVAPVALAVRLFAATRGGSPRLCGPGFLLFGPGRASRRCSGRGRRGPVRPSS
ncbi:hypothetical protein GTX07_21985 [Streptomyces sp. SID5606]|nr:hypothetical protein [Streptomyces sp. SID5606]